MKIGDLGSGTHAAGEQTGIGRYVAQSNIRFVMGAGSVHDDLPSRDKSGRMVTHSRRLSIFAWNKQVPESYFSKEVDTSALSKDIYVYMHRRTK